LLIAPGFAVLAFLLVLPFPAAGLFRLSALIVRGEPTNLSDALAWRSFAKRAVGAGLVIGGVSLALGLNVLVGLSSVDPVGWSFATAAFWGLIVVWLISAAIWPLLFDPLRANEPVTTLIRLAATVIFASAARYLALLLVLTILMVITTILVAALLTISAAYFALTMAQYVIPAADRIEGRRTIVVTS
jgi:hypothetical protein